jgi:cysteine-rich repeat protein
MVAAASLTLMACYGAMDDGRVGDGCQYDWQCPFACNDDWGTCSSQDEQCGNGVDDDGDGLVDGADADCGALSEQCGNGYDDDYDGLYDCEDPDCGYFCGYEAQCADGKDDDGDGLVDCDDPDCFGACGVETQCFDGYDDDYDGLYDCDDPDCAEACGQGLELCDDGEDDDGDGLVDCDDPDCAGLCGVGELVCDDDLDGDGDGLVDCDDPDCAEACGAPTCGNGLLEAGEGCDDGGVVAGDGCSELCAPEVPVLCAQAAPLALGVTQGSTEGGAVTELSCGVGPERAYVFSPPQDGVLSLSVTGELDLALRLEVGCGEASLDVACVNEGPGSLEQADVLLPAGAPIYVFVDGVAPLVGGTFELTASFSPAE